MDRYQGIKNIVTTLMELGSQGRQVLHLNCGRRAGHSTIAAKLGMEIPNVVIMVPNFGNIAMIQSIIEENCPEQSASYTNPTCFCINGKEQPISNVTLTWKVKPKYYPKIMAFLDLGYQAKGCDLLICDSVDKKRIDACQWIPYIKPKLLLILG